MALSLFGESHKHMPPFNPAVTRALAQGLARYSGGQAPSPGQDTPYGGTNVRLGFDAFKAMAGGANGGGESVIPVVSQEDALVPFSVALTCAAATTSTVTTDAVPFDGVIKRVSVKGFVTASGVANAAIDRILISQQGRAPLAQGIGLSYDDLAPNQASVVRLAYPVIRGTPLVLSARELANLASTLDVTLWIATDSSQYSVGGCAIPATYANG